MMRYADAKARQRSTKLFDRERKKKHICASCERNKDESAWGHRHVCVCVCKMREKKRRGDGPIR